MPFSDAAAVFIVIPADNVTAAVPNALVLTIVSRHLRGNTLFNASLSGAELSGTNLREAINLEQDQVDSA